MAPLLTGQGCPSTGNQDPIKLVEQVSTLLPACQTFLNGTTLDPTVCDISVVFNPTEAGRTVSVSVRGDATGSRIRLRVLDPVNNPVLNFVTPTTSTSSGSFVSTTTGAHTLIVTETASPSSTYRISVQQQ